MGRVRFSDRHTHTIDHAGGVPVWPFADHSCTVVLHQVNDTVAHRVLLAQQPKRTIWHLEATEPIRVLLVKWYGWITMAPERVGAALALACLWAFDPFLPAALAVEACVVPICAAGYEPESALRPKGRPLTRPMTRDKKPI